MSLPAAGPLPTSWDQDGLGAVGFTGFVTFSDLAMNTVPAGSGVYAVLRTSTSEPVFRETSPAGRFKGRDPSVPVEELVAAWVPDAQVLYLGKADVGASGRRGLARRLGEYRRFGTGEPVGHWGGRYVFQLADADELIVAWRPSANGARAVETMLLDAFVDEYGRLPFANLVRGRTS